MIDLAYDIASGANYKFNTAAIGETVRLHDGKYLKFREGLLIEQFLCKGRLSYKKCTLQRASMHTYHQKSKPVIVR